MVAPDNLVFLSHIRDSCRKALDFIGGYDYSKFKTDEKTVSAVLRELSVIGEAARKISEEFRQKHPKIPWDQIFGMRNRLVHDYMGVQLPIVWQTIQDDIPALLKITQEILDSEKWPLFLTKNSDHLEGGLALPAGRQVGTWHIPP